MTEIRMDIEGLKEIAQDLREVPQDMVGAFSSAGKEAAVEIVNTTGLGEYPAAGPGNSPPTPYYIRGQGTQYASYNDGRSENYGKQFYVNSDQGYTTEIGNRTSYAHYLADENRQARHMAAIGWRKLIDVAVQKLPILEKIYQGWVDRLLKSKGLT